MKTSNIQPLQILPKPQEIPEHPGPYELLLEDMEWTSGDALLVLLGPVKGSHCVTLTWCTKDENQKYHERFSLGSFTTKDLEALGSMLVDCAGLADGFMDCRECPE
mgnify:CR=1 FL=1